MKYLFIVLLIISSHLVLLVQNSVSIGTEEINGNAVLQLVSQNNNQRFLVTRLTTSQRETMQLNSDANGMLVFDIDPGYFFYWHSGVWFPLISNEIQNLSDVLSQGNDAGSAVITGLAEPINNTDASTKLYVDNEMNNSWKTTGNNGTTESTNYVGTSDNVNLHVRTNGTDRIVIDGANGNVNVTSNVNTAGEYQYNTDKDIYLTFSFTDLQIEGGYSARYEYNYIDNFTEAFLPVHLPDNATIRDVIVGVRDETPTASITFLFTEKSYLNEAEPSGSEIIFEKTTPGFTYIIVNDINRVVNNFNYSYYMRITCTAPANALSFVGARIHYTVNQAG